MNLSIFGCSLDVGNMPTSSGIKFGFRFKTEQHKKDIEASREWERKACMYYDRILVLESALRALDPSFSENKKTVDAPYK